jgi:hypothetical protein
LPQIEDGQPIEHIHYIYAEPGNIVHIDSFAMEDSSSIREIKVGEKLDLPHPIVKKTGTMLRNLTLDKYGMLSVSHEYCFGVRISSESIDRALRILDALIKEFESQGFLISTTSGRKTETRIEIHGEKIYFSLIEDVRQKDHVLTDEEKKNQERGTLWSIRRWDFVPTGRLALIIETFGATGVRKRWADSSKRRLEELLGDFIKGTIQVSRVVKCERAKRDEQRKKREEEQRRREEEEKARKTEEARLIDLERLAEQWMKSEQLKSFVEAIKREAAKRDYTEDIKERVQRWLQWAMAHAEQLDPINRLLK